MNIFIIFIAQSPFSTEKRCINKMCTPVKIIKKRFLVSLFTTNLGIGSCYETSWVRKD